jgi:ribonuclease-3
VDLGQRGAMGSDRRGVLSGDLAAWLTALFGRVPADTAPFVRALTHGSQASDNYERLEFLGDRVLGLIVAEWLWETFPRDAEGQLSKRLNALVTGAVCAEVARDLGVRDHLKLGKQARDDGAIDSDNVLGDAMEALIGAWYREAGLDAARDFVRRAWGDRVHADAKAPQHPKSALHDGAAAHPRRAPSYAVTDRSGPHHAPRFTITVSIGPDEASATGTNKQEAETAAAKALLAKLGA